MQYVAIIHLQLNSTEHLKPILSILFGTFSASVTTIQHPLHISQWISSVFRYALISALICYSRRFVLCNITCVVYIIFVLSLKYGHYFYSDATPSIFCFLSDAFWPIIILCRTVTVLTFWMRDMRAHVQFFCTVFIIRSRLRWGGDNIKIDLQEVGWGDTRTGLIWRRLGTGGGHL